MDRERRKRERIALQCPVRIVASAAGHSGDAIAVNLSCQGIYWISQLPFTPGEQIHCAIFIPHYGFQAEPGRVTLECRVRVVRVEQTSGGFGAGCRIEEYALGKAQVAPPVDDLTMMLQPRACPA